MNLDHIVRLHHANLKFIVGLGPSEYSVVEYDETEFMDMVIDILEASDNKFEDAMKIFKVSSAVARVEMWDIYKDLEKIYDNELTTGEYHMLKFSSVIAWFNLQTPVTFDITVAFDGENDMYKADSNFEVPFSKSWRLNGRYQTYLTKDSMRFVMDKANDLEISVMEDEVSND